MKERFLTVLVPIKDSDATTVTNLPAVSPDNINVIYKHAGVYKRVWLNPTTNQYEYHEVVDREFPYLGKPLEIFDFTYDATRMGPAPTITAQGVMWFADKDADGNDITLESLWQQECHVSFNGENFYLKQIPTSSKSNEDARYKYDIDFVSERAVLERVYLYDVVQPFVSSKPISESAQFSFYGDITELAKRINASLLRSGLASIALRPGVTPGSYLTYEEFNSVGLGTYTGTKDTSDPYPIVPGEMQTYIHYPHANIYEHFGGNYTLYLLNRVYLVDNPVSYHIGPSDSGYDVITDGDPRLSGYKCLIGKDKKGVMTTSEEKLITFENNTIHEALQQFHDTFELQYYIYRDTDSNGDFTGDTIIMVADCQHDFADWDATAASGEGDYTRDSDGIPTTTHPFDYGVEDALLSKEKTNTTDKIITRITGVGSEENIPWYYPNPNADGWLRPMYMTNGVEQSTTINYPTSEGTTVADSVRYEKYLKNRVTDVFQFGKKICTVNKKASLVSKFSTYTSYVDETSARLCYDFTLSYDARIKSDGFSLTGLSASITYYLFKGTTNVTASGNAFLINGGSGTLEAGDYHLIINITFSGTEPTPVTSVTKYYYPAKNRICGWIDTFGFGNLNGALAMGLGLLALAAVISDLCSGGFACHLPSFFSTNPNLTWNNSSDGSKMGWYDGNRRIAISEMEFCEANSETYAFMGGSGAKTLGVDDVYKVTCDNDTWVSSYNLQLKGIQWDDLYDIYCLYMDWVNGLRASKRSATSVEEVDVSVDSFVNNNVVFGLTGYLADGWYKNNKKYALADFGITNESTLNQNADVFDTIEFQRIKYVTPQTRLMPELYIKTDGERRFYNAHNYYVNGSLLTGTADPMIGEVQSGTKVKNPLYKEKETDADNKHYQFENEYVQIMPHEHIEEFDDVKPTIKGQKSYIRAYPTEDDFYLDPTSFYEKIQGQYIQCTTETVYSDTSVYYQLVRIDIVEEFAFDELDNNEIWESNEDGNTSGEYKHPYFFAKLRPMGFNIFDLALQDEMILSMTTGHCGACNFKIAVDENTKKNPVQIWEYDVYGGFTYATKGVKLYSAGELRRVIDSSNLHYDTDGTSDGYILVDSNPNALTTGFLIDGENTGAARSRRFERTTYTAEEVTNGRVGSLKLAPKRAFEGDVMTSGKFIDSQQDTSEGFVWIALYKDTETYGALMPSAQPDYGDDNYSHYIDPKGHIYTDRKTGLTEVLEDDEADKFVLTNIRLPQAYLRRAERDLSRKIIAYMYDNNYQKFNFSIKFSRIYLAENDTIEGNLNENSVLYVTFNNKIYRQYAKHYTYRMAHDAALPEISVEMNEELSVSRTSIEQQAALQAQATSNNNRRWRRELNEEIAGVRRITIGRGEDVVISGNIFSRDSRTSIRDLAKEREIDVGDLNLRHFSMDDFTLFNGTDLRIGDQIFLPTAFKRGQRIIRRKWDNTSQKFVEDANQLFAPAFIDDTNKRFTQVGFVQLSGSSAPTFATNTYYKLENGAYILLEEAPDDWATSWTSYYEENVNLDFVPARVNGHRILHGASGVMRPAFISGNNIVDYTTISSNVEIESNSMTPAKQSDVNIIRHTVEQRFLDKGWANSSPTCGGSSPFPSKDITTITVDNVQYLFWTNEKGQNISYQGSGSGQCQQDPFESEKQ